MTDDLNAPALVYTPEQLRADAKAIEDLRFEFLFDRDSAGADVESEQYYLLAISSLETAHRFMSLAAIKQSQGIVR